MSSCSSDAPCDADKLVLNEVCHKDADCGVAEITTGDWLEIHNPSGSSAELSGCYIRVVDQGELQLQTLVGWIPGYEAATVEPGGFWLLSGVPTLFNAGKDEVVSLLDADQSAINSLVTSSALSIDGDSESTTCRIDDGTVTPTPGATNSCGL